MTSIIDDSLSVLRESKERSTTLAGNVAQTVPGGWPVTNKFQVVDTIFLVSVIPKSLDRRPISIGTEAHAAIVVTVAVSPKDQNPAIPGPATRDHYARIKFGTASGEHYVELDVTEGNTVSIPCSSLEVEFFDETPRPSLNGVEPRDYPLLQDSVNIAHFARSGAGVRTLRVWQPLFFNVASLGTTELETALASFTPPPNPALRAIPPFARTATLVSASLDINTQGALYFLGRNLQVVGLVLYSLASTVAVFGRDAVAVPLQAEFVAVASNLPIPIAPAEQSDVFFVRFGLAV